MDPENLEQCARHLVSLDGSEGRQSKPYRMTRAANFAGMGMQNLWLQPEGYNPSGILQG